MRTCRPACLGGGCQCNGICTNMQTDPRHCGTCGNRCPGTQVCQSGTCVEGGSDVDAGPPTDDAGPTEDAGPADDAGGAPDEDASMSGGA